MTMFTIHLYFFEQIKDILALVDNIPSLDWAKSMLRHIQAFLSLWYQIWLNFSLQVINLNKINSWYDNIININNKDNFFTFRGMLEDQTMIDLTLFEVMFVDNITKSFKICFRKLFFPIQGFLQFASFLCHQIWEKDSYILPL